MNKRGISEVVTAILLVLLAIAAVIVVWNVVSSFISKTGEGTGVESLTANLDIKEARIEGTTAYVKIKRGVGEGNIGKIKLVFSNAQGEQQIETINQSIAELETKTYSASINISNPTKLEIYPVFIVNGQEKIGLVKADSESFGEVVGCINGQTRNCANQQGVCAGSQETCINGAWPGCTSANYIANNAAYESTETSCDGLDNDCDGSVDEGYVSTSTSCGVGICAASGNLVCTNGVVTNTCTPGTPGTESIAVGNCADSLDNDCDTLIDTDPECSSGEEIIETVVGTVWDYKFGGVYYKAEPFRFVTGNLYATQFCFKNIRKSSTAITFGDITVQIRTVTGSYNVPTSTVLATNIISQASVSTTAAEVCVSFVSPPLLTQNTVYSMVASSPSSENLAYEWGRGGELYGGTSFRPSKSDDSDLTWSTMGSNVDFAFKIVGSPAP